MHIAISYMYYLRPGGSGMRRFNEFCRIWAEQSDVQITVLAGIFDHFERATFPGLSARQDTLEHDGPVRVLRVGSPETYAGGFVQRAWTQYWWGRNCVRALSKTGKPDLFIASSPSLWATLPMIWAKRRWGIPTIFEIRDLWPEALVQHQVAGPRNPAVLYLGHLERAACRHADHSVVLIETMRNSLTRRGLMSSERITTIPNGIMLEKYDKVDPRSRQVVRSKLGLPEAAFVTMFVGSITRSHGIGTLVELAAALQGEPRFRFVCVGEGPERAMAEAAAREQGLDNLLFTGAIPTDEVAPYLSAADCGIVLGDTADTTAWDNDTRGNFRNSFFDAAGAKLPVVFNIPGFPVAEIAGRAKGGFYAASTADLAQRVQELAADPQLARQVGDNNYREIAVRYNRRKLAGDYLELMRRMTSTARSTS